MTGYNADLRATMERETSGIKFKYKGHEYMIISGLIIQDLTTGDYLMLGVDF